MEQIGNFNRKSEAQGLTKSKNCCPKNLRHRGVETTMDCGYSQPRLKNPLKHDFYQGYTDWFKNYTGWYKLVNHKNKD